MQVTTRRKADEECRAEGDSMEEVDIWWRGNVGVPNLQVKSSIFVAQSWSKAKPFCSRGPS